MGIFESRDKPKYVLCVAFLQTGDIITGDSNGNLAIWGRGTNTILQFIKNVHEGSIFSICVLKDGSFMTGGGKDGRIVHFDSNLMKTGHESEVSTNQRKTFSFYNKSLKRIYKNIFSAHFE